MKNLFADLKNLQSLSQSIFFLWWIVTDSQSVIPPVTSQLADGPIRRRQLANV